MPGCIVHDFVHPVSCSRLLNEGTVYCLCCSSTFRRLSRGSVGASRTGQLSAIQHAYAIMARPADNEYAGVATFLAHALNDVLEHPGMCHVKYCTLCDDLVVFFQSSKSVWSVLNGEYHPPALPRSTAWTPSGKKWVICIPFAYDIRYLTQTNLST